MIFETTIHILLRLMYPKILSQKIESKNIVIIASSFNKVLGERHTFK